MMQLDAWSTTFCAALQLCGRPWRFVTMRTNQNWQARLLKLADPLYITFRILYVPVLIRLTQLNFIFFVWDESIFYPNNAGTYPKIRSSWVSTIGGAVEFDGFLNIFLIDAYCGPASFDHGQPRWWLFRGWCTAPWASPEPMERDPGMEPLVQIKLA